MSYLVIYTVYEQVIAGRSQTYHQKINNLNEINNLKVDKIIGIYEIAREVPFDTKYREEEKIIQRKPYYEVDGSIEVSKQSSPYSLFTEESAISSLQESFEHLKIGLGLSDEFGPR
jgi:hypothetical protein